MVAHKYISSIRITSETPAAYLYAPGVGWRCGLDEHPQHILVRVDETGNTMSNAKISSIVIVGGGTAGWMSAALLAQVLKGRYAITLVESDEIGTVGVGEATIPVIQLFNRLLGINEEEFLRETGGTFKLGIEFIDWGRPGDRYMHAFGRFGHDALHLPFDNYWQRLYQSGKAADLAEYSINRMAAKANRFMHPRSDPPNSPLADIAYAYHFDASRYARYLRKYAESRGVRRIEGKILDVRKRGTDGHIDALLLDGDRLVSGDIFIDCTGFRALLIEGALETGFEDWSHWLPCDRAVAIPCASSGPLTPYTRSTARQAGWQWRIPLQHRIGNGHVFCSSYISEDEATATLLAHLDGEALAEPRALRFKTGMRRLGWNRNVVAVGLSSGFLEPLESTSIHLIQTAITRLITYFPDQGFDAPDIDEYNRQCRLEYERVRDFIILHYHLNQRTDFPFWRRCSSMQVPGTLQRKLALYRSHGRLVRDDNELFAEVAWLQVMHGQGLRPRHCHPLAEVPDEGELARHLDNIRRVVASVVERMPDHAEYLKDYSAAKA